MLFDVLVYQLLRNVGAVKRRDNMKRTCRPVAAIKCSIIKRVGMWSSTSLFWDMPRRIV